MNLVKWFHELMNPHCEHCAIERREQRLLELEAIETEKRCDSCEILKHELALKTRENERLLNKIFEVPPQLEDRKVAPTPTSVVTRNLPWAARKQVLEQADREQAASLRKAAVPDNPVKTPADLTVKLENELELTKDTDDV